MKYICPECGNEIRKDAEFCHTCGCVKSKAIIFDDKMKMVSGSMKCAFCGGDIAEGDIFCQHCGKTITRQQMITFKPTFNASSAIGIALALIPAFFNIFGLGHLFFRKWKRAAVYLCITALFLFVQYQMILTSTERTIFEITSILVYVIHGMEIFTLALMPRPSSK
ncbi:MAG: zinc ribbon domain-containing protein [Candidatus Methanomethylophilaceae archaeon]|nr:zinc ribbon domain-containing protein [Candidatus Methanomethylophilaceae archaeon]MDD3378583.1 zinc ribbon domain-containing protein [Candidatus Methanomethylophilaceae archaeon]